MSWEALSLVLAIHAVALISPGPDFAVVTRLSIVSGRDAGVWAAAGVACAIGAYVLVCVLGLALVLAALPGLAQALAVAGAAYLAWLGVQCLRSRGKLSDGVTLDNGVSRVGSERKRNFPFGSIGGGFQFNEWIRVDAAYERCEDILSRDQKHLIAVAEFLLAHETMSAEEFEAVFTDEAAGHDKI